MLLINVFIIKKLIKKWKIQRILLQFQMYFFSDWHVIKHSCKCLSIYINIIVTFFLILNSLILFSHRKICPAVYYLFSCPKDSISSQQKHFNLMWIIQILYPSVYFSFARLQETKSNMCNQIEVLLQRDFRLKSLKFNKTLYSGIITFP